MKQKQLMLGVLAVLVTGIILLSGCTQEPASQTNTQTTGTQTNTQSTGAPATQGPVKCTDPICFSTQFMNCNSSELKMAFMENTTYVITVSGLEDGKCHYSTKITDASGVNVPGMPAVDCKIPKEMITADTLSHFFGQDNAPGKETVKAQQDKLQSDYCTTQ